MTPTTLFVAEVGMERIPSRIRKTLERIERMIKSMGVVKIKRKLTGLAI